MSEDLPPPATGAKERKGIVIGILVIVLLALLVFFYCHSTGARDSRGSRPPKPTLGQPVNWLSPARHVVAGALESDRRGVNGKPATD